MTKKKGNNKLAIGVATISAAIAFIAHYAQVAIGLIVFAGILLLIEIGRALLKN